MMNSKFIATAVITLAALSSASAFAASSNQYAEPAEFAGNSMTSSLTRAQVRAEYLAARQSGMLPVGQEFDFKSATKAGSNLSRAQVKSEIMTSGTSEQNKLYSNAK